MPTPVSQGSSTPSCALIVRAGVPFAFIATAVQEPFWISQVNDWVPVPLT